MTRRIILSWGIVCIFLSPLTFSQYLKQNVFIVNLKEGTGVINIIHRNGTVSLGIPSIDALLRKFQVVEMEPEFPGERMPAPGSNLIDLTRYYILQFTFPADVIKVINEFKKNPHFQYVGPVIIQPVDSNPNDPSFTAQWGITKIQAPDAWNLTSGNSTVRLAIIDTGVDWDHPDLAGPSPYTNGNIWINWAEWNGTSGIDDDGNGYVDDIRGWDFVTGVSGTGDVAAAPGEDGETPDNNPMDFQGHGTHVAGIAAAMTNNSTGVVGVAGGWYSSQRGSQIMSLRAGWKGNDGKGYVDMTFCAQAINYARLNGASVINCSWSSAETQDLANAVTNAISAGVIVVKSAGNSNSETPDYLNNRGDCFSVASTDQNDIKSSISNYGSWVDASAPGVSIYSTFFNDGYGNLSGTSMAAPHVTAVAGLVKIAHPTLNRTQIESTIKLSTDNIDGQNPGYIGKLGSGRINANKAVRNLYVPQVYSTIGSALSAAVSGQRVVVSSGSYSIGSNLTVSSGVTLQISSGSTLTFSGYYKLLIQGMLIANGATFQGNGSSGSWFGIELSSGTINDIQNCTIKDAQYGLLFTGSYAGTYMNNSIRNNSQGVYASSYSDPSFFQNGFTSNGIDVYGDNTSVPDLGSLPGSGYNSFRSYTQVHSAYPGTIYANFNWWGSHPPNPNVSSNVDYSNALSYDPVPSLKIINAENPLTAQFKPSVVPHTTMAIEQSLDDDALSELNAAYKLFIASNYATALSAFEAIVGRYPTTFAAKRALVFVERCLDRLGRSPELFERLNTLAVRYRGLSLGHFLQFRNAVAFIRVGNYKEAMQQSSVAISQMTDSTDLKIALYTVGSLAFHQFGDRPMAERYFNQLIRMFPFDALSKSAMVTLGGERSQQNNNQYSLTSSGVSSKERNLGLQNYPNPFNPTTVIHFTLPQSGFVSLKVFDMLGREVATLLNDYRTAGSHQVSFNASSLTSGVYFYKLEASGATAMQKMLLVK